MGVLANVLERCGLSTIALSLVRAQALVTRPPRALHCEFPLGRPLGRPNDAEFQHSVLASAFDLLERPQGPVLEDFPEVIADEAEQPLSCPLPLVDDPDLHPAVCEAIGLRDAYERQRLRTARTGVGRVVNAAGVPAALETFLAVAEGTDPDALDAPGPLPELALDVRSYFEEAATELSDHVPAARQTEAWFFGGTRAGKLLVEAKRRLRLAGHDRSVWWPIAPLTQEPAEERMLSWQQSRK